MTRVQSIAAASALTILALYATVGAQQSDTQEVTYFTFSHAVELPGVMLEPGTYEFRLADTPQRNVVQVLRKDRSEVMGQWTFVQASRPRTSDETVVMFRETAEGDTPAVQYWYYPGEQIGKEFIYPDDQAAQIAARTGQRVRANDGFVTSEAEGPTASARVEADVRSDVDLDAEARRDEAAARTDASTASAPAQPSAPAGSTTGSRGIDQAGAAATEPQPTSARQPIEDRLDSQRPVGTSGIGDQAPATSLARASDLPATASPLALTGIIGLLSLAGAWGLRRLYR